MLEGAMINLVLVVVVSIVLVYFQYNFKPSQFVVRLIMYGILGWNLGTLSRALDISFGIQLLVVFANVLLIYLVAGFLAKKFPPRKNSEPPQGGC